MTGSFGSVCLFSDMKRATKSSNFVFTTFLISIGFLIFPTAGFVSASQAGDEESEKYTIELLALRATYERLGKENPALEEHIIYRSIEPI
jgi:hypothetical protein